MKIQKADPAARRRSLLVVGLVAMVAFVLFVAGLVFGLDTRELGDALAAYLLAAPRQGIVMMAIGAAPVALFAIYLFVFGARVIRAERYPLPGQAVARDTPIREGRAAVIHGRVLQVLSSLLLLAAASLPWLLARVLAAAAGA